MTREVVCVGHAQNGEGPYSDAAPAVTKTPAILVLAIVTEPNHVLYIINTSYEKLPFGSGDYPISSDFTKH